MINKQSINLHQLSRTPPLTSGTNNINFTDQNVGKYQFHRGTGLPPSGAVVLLASLFSFFYFLVRTKYHVLRIQFKSSNYIWLFITLAALTAPSVGIEG